ncbi:hypothetical protein Tco_0145405 [Tanacetum coccineum]
MFLNVDQLEKQLDKEEFQDIESMAAFKVLETQFQKFIKLRISLNDEDESGKRDISSRLGNDVDSDDADIKPIYDEELIAEIQLTAKWQQGQFLKEKSNEGKVKHDIDVIETIRIELEHKVAKLLKENETLKKHYKELSDSIKTTRAKTIEHTTYLIAQNAEFNA